MSILKTDKLQKDFEDWLIDRFAKIADWQPKLHIGLIGDDFVSSKYVKMKLQFAKKIGVEGRLYHLQKDTSADGVIKLLTDFQFIGGGALFQLPVPTPIYKYVRQIPCSMDVDMMGQENLKLWDEGFLPPTIMAIDLVLKEMILPSNLSLESRLTARLDLSGLKVAVIGQGRLVGSPLLTYLSDKQASIFSLNEFSPEIQNICREADIIITATGKANLINQDWLGKKRPRGGVTWPILIDAGTSEYQAPTKLKTDSSKICGDVDREAINPDDGSFCLTPGGIGPLTVRCIFYNLYRLLTIYQYPYKAHNIRR